MEYPLYAREASSEVAFPARPAWPGVELRHLVAFQAVVAAGSFIGAANRLGYTQSGVSAQIRTLERLIGSRLIDRTRGARGVALTKEGAILLRYAREIVAGYQAAAEHLRRGAPAPSQALRVGTFRSASLALAAPAVARVTADDPDFAISLVEDENPDVLLALLDEGELELAFVIAPAPKEFETRVLRHERFVALAADGVIPQRRRLRISDLSEQRVLVDETPTGAMLGQAARDAGSRAITVVPDHTVAVALALTGLGVALLPELSVIPAVGLRALPLEDELPARAIGLAWASRRPRSDPARLFVRAATAVAHRDRIVALPPTRSAGGRAMRD
ncbi:MAG TPA: LysR family transcriptional regulator [Gaiellaceae bacterium]